ncbi:MAG: YidC/Oxa1 family insertase periplasmic-domain containing protein, partial [Planctomycetota bacterium]
MNRSNRTTTIILLGSLMLLLMLNLQNRFQPEQVGEGDEAALVDGQDADEQDADEQDGEEGSGEPGSESDADGDDESAENEEATQDNDEDNEPPAAKPEPPEQMFQLGSLDPDSGYRFLVTLNSVGAAVRRVELNMLNHRGRLKYRDLEYEGGFAGELELEETPEGLRIGFVGAGSPAETAGLQEGDVITSIAGAPVALLDDYSAELGRTRAGDTVDFTVNRVSNAQVTARVALTDKPIEVIGPEPETFDPEREYPESFILSLMRPQPTGKNWDVLDIDMASRSWAGRSTNEVVNGNETEVVEFTYELSSEELDAFDIAGPIKVIKRYSLQKMTEEQAADPDSRAWHVGFDIEIINESDEDTRIGYQLNGPTGLPIEGWWYQIKIHGGGSLFKSAAGARDVIASSSGRPFVFIGGPEIAKNAQTAWKKDRTPEINWIFDPGSGNETDINYIGVDTLYFSSMLLPHQTADGESEPFDLFSAMGWHTADDAMLPDNFKQQRLVPVTPLMFEDVELAGNASYRQQFDIFCGPKEAGLLTTYQLEESQSYGWFGFISKPLCALLHFFYTLTFKVTYAIPIIMLTVLVRCIMIPFSRKAALNAQMMQHLSPKMKEIADKYKDDMEKRAQAQRELFKKHKYNPFGGCLMMFFQLPIFLGLYRGLSVDIALRDQPLMPGLNWCTNLAAPDMLLRWDSWMPSFLAGENGWLGPYLNVLPLITMVLFLVQQKLFTPPPTDDQQRMMQKMMSFMMIAM